MTDRLRCGGACCRPTARSPQSHAPLRHLLSHRFRQVSSLTGIQRCWRNRERERPMGTGRSRPMHQAGEDHGFLTPDVLGAASDFDNLNRFCKSREVSRPNCASGSTHRQARGAWQRNLLRTPPVLMPADQSGAGHGLNQHAGRRAPAGRLMQHPADSRRGDGGQAPK
jgi:hypothetical protein